MGLFGLLWVLVVDCFWICWLFGLILACGFSTSDGFGGVCG